MELSDFKRDQTVLVVAGNYCVGQIGRVVWVSTPHREVIVDFSSDPADMDYAFLPENLDIIPYLIEELHP